MNKQSKGLQGIMVNPVKTISVDTPINSDKNFFISAFLFEKSKWKPTDAIKWAKGKIGIKEPVKCVHVGNFYRVNTVKNKAKKEYKTPINPDRGIYAVMGYNDVGNSVDLQENPRPRKVTGDVVRFILQHKDNTPKEINTLLAEHFKDKSGNPLHLHPGTIYKISRRKYRVSDDVGSSVGKNNKEVNVTLNPLIAELTGNPTIPIYKTKWYQDRVKGMVKKGMTAYQIAQQLNKVLGKLPKHIWVKQAKARVGPGGTVGRERKTILTPKSVLRSIIGTKTRPGFMPRVARWKLLDPKMLRGRARKLYDELGSMKKVVQQLQAEMARIRTKRTPPYTSAKTRAAMSRFPKFKKRKNVWASLSEEEKKNRIARMLAAKQAKKGGTIKFSAKTKKKYGVSLPADVGAGDILGYTDYADYDVMNDIDEFDLATLPLEEFGDIEEMADAINPMIRMPNIQGLLTKLGNMVLGQVPAAWALKIADWLAEKITFLLPPGPIKNIVTEFLADGAVYGIAEAFLPYRFASIQQAAQNVALLKFLSNVGFGTFQLIPIEIFGSRSLVQPQTQSEVSKEVGKEVNKKVDSYFYSDAVSPHDEILGTVDASILGNAVERELTEEEVAQLLGSPYAQPAQYNYEPEMEVHQALTPEAVSARQELNQ